MKRLICIFGVAVMVLAFGPATYAADDFAERGGDDFGAQVSWSSGNQFSPQFQNKTTFNVYKDLNFKNTYRITVADFGSSGEKFRVVARTTTGDTLTLVFKSKVTGYGPCTVVTDPAASWPGARDMYSWPTSSSNMGYFSVVKMKLLQSSKSLPQLAYIHFWNPGTGDAGWRQTAGWNDSCGW